MTSSGKLLVLFCAVIIAQANAHNLAPRPTKRPTVNKRCERNSVTPVSCAEITLRQSVAPHPDDCRLFYYCVHPFHPPICRQCPAKLHFNPTLLVCDYPYRAGCQKTTTTLVATTLPDVASVTDPSTVIITTTAEPRTSTPVETIVGTERVTIVPTAETTTFEDTTTATSGAPANEQKPV